MDKTLEILRQTFLFKGIENALDTAALPTPVSFKKGETIYGETDFRRALGILVSGKAKATPLFPVQVGPTRASISPGRQVKETSFSTGFPSA